LATAHIRGLGEYLPGSGHCLYDTVITMRVNAAIMGENAVGQTV
jgi:hypothetical protein